MGNTLEELDRLKEARESYKKASEISPNFAEALINLSGVHYSLNDLDQAALCLEQAMKTDDDLFEHKAAVQLAILKFLEEDFINESENIKTNSREFEKLLFFINVSLISIF